MNGVAVQSMKLGSAIGIAVLLATGIAMPALAQTQAPDSCNAPALTGTPGASMFTPAQEVVLGEIVAEQLGSKYVVISDDQLTSYVNGEVSRILAQIGPTGLTFRVSLFDSPYPSAFSLSGGRIYVSRKMVSFLTSEDELTALLAHEIGHIVTHQSAIDMTSLFIKVLGVREVSSAQDVVHTYNSLLDNAARRPEAFRPVAQQEEPDQYVADQVALWLLARTGHDPAVLSTLLQRLTDTKAKSGGFLSDWFGVRTPEQKRLAQMQQALAVLPAACIATRPAAANDEFRAWQAAVLRYSPSDRGEQIPGLIQKKALAPPLRGDLSNLKFSPDGKYALAQDDAEIFVLTRNPFAVRFRIDAPGASPAEFTPDSSNVVFETAGLRAEKWNTSNGEQTSTYDIPSNGKCLWGVLSPDGELFACLVEKEGGPFHYDLEIRSVVTNELVFTKAKFIEVTGLPFNYNALIAALVDSLFVRSRLMAFSPDAHYFAAGIGRSTLGVDLKTRTELNLRGAAEQMLGGGFAFLGPDRVIIENSLDQSKSVIASFPDGDVKQRVVLGHQRLDAAAHGNYALLRPLKDAKTGVMDLQTGKMVMLSKEISALDVYDQIGLVQDATGEVALYNIASQRIEARVSLPQSLLGPHTVYAVSPDLRWLAASGETRGAVWDLASMKELYFVRGFLGCYFEGPALYADFPKDGATTRTIARAALAGPQIDKVVNVDADSKVTKQFGQYLVTQKPNKSDDDRRDITLQMQSARDGAMLWNARYPKERPQMEVVPQENRLILAWSLDDDAAKDEIKGDPKLQAQFSAIRQRGDSYLIEVLEAATGKVLGRLLVDTGKGSFDLLHAYAAADWLMIADSENRTLLYSVSSGDLKGSVFGRNAAYDSATGLMGIENEEGQLQIYSLPSLEKRALEQFSAPISMKQFSPDGKYLFVLTRNQNVYTLDAAALGRSLQ